MVAFFLAGALVGLWVAKNLVVADFRSALGVALPPLEKNPHTGLDSGTDRV